MQVGGGGGGGGETLYIGTYMYMNRVLPKRYLAMTVPLERACSTALVIHQKRNHACMKSLTRPAG